MKPERKRKKEKIWVEVDVLEAKFETNLRNAAVMNVLTLQKLRGPMDLKKKYLQ